MYLYMDEGYSTSWEVLAGFREELAFIYLSQRVCRMLFFPLNEERNPSRFNWLPHHNHNDR